MNICTIWHNFAEASEVVHDSAHIRKGLRRLCTTWHHLPLGSCNISKIFEYVIFDQLLHYYIENNLLSMVQYGFCPGHSTELAVARLVDHLISQMDNYCTPTNVYIDLSKAFDTLNHNILLSRLQYYGITGCPNNLLCSYLSGRSQYVENSGSKSEKLSIDTGVSQGSVLGPNSFLYI